jgi:NAD-dependent DNA ligase
MSSRLQPAWHFDPATIPQLKVLRFFAINIGRPITKGLAWRIIGRLFSDPANKHLWAAYVYTTGNEDPTSEDILPHDKAALAEITIPDDWRLKRGPGMPSAKRKAVEELVRDVLRDGSPFDDPPPDVSFKGTTFCFTGRFEFGSRRDCQEAVVARGGFFTNQVNSSTDVLVIGCDANPTWAKGSYGRKIEEAMVLRMQQDRPVIIPEAHWTALLGTPADL